MNTAARIIILATALFFLGNTGVWAKVAPDIRVDYPVMEAGRGGELHVWLQFDAPMVRRDHRERPPLNLGLVLDRSGSMADRGKLDYARQAAIMLVNSLRPEDRLTLVQYDSTVQTLWDGAPVGNGAALRRILQDMRPGGATNLHDGLREGVEKCIKNRGRGSLNRVFLLSDGLANVGQTSHGAIAQVAAMGRRHGVRVSSMGLGADYDEDLMQAVAEAGGGSYHFIEHPSQTAAIYQRELEVLSAMVTRDFSLRFVPSGLVTGITVHGFVQEREHGALSVIMDDFHAGEKRSLLIRLDVASVAETGNDLGRFEWSYVDLSTGRQERGESAVRVRGSRNQAEVQARADKDVVAEAFLVRADAAHRDALRLFESGQVDVARDRLLALKSTLAEQEAAAPSVALRKKMEALDVEAQMQRESAEDETLRSTYLKKSKLNIFNSSQGRRQATMLGPGDSGRGVLALQQALQESGVYAGPMDGAYSAEVENAVRLFQRREGLSEDGVAGPKVLQGLGLY